MNITSGFHAAVMFESSKTHYRLLPEESHVLTYSNVIRNRVTMKAMIGYVVTLVEE